MYFSNDFRCAFSSDGHLAESHLCQCKCGDLWVRHAAKKTPVSDYKKDAAVWHKFAFMLVLFFTPHLLETRLNFQTRSKHSQLDQPPSRCSHNHHHQHVHEHHQHHHHHWWVVLKDGFQEWLRRLVLKCVSLKNGSEEWLGTVVRNGGVREKGQREDFQVGVLWG